MTQSKLLRCLAIAAMVAIIPACGDDEDSTLPGDNNNGGDNGGNNGGNDSGFTALYNTTTFSMCQGCHAPGAPGFVDGTEATMNWSSRDSAYAALQGNASGLIGNFEGCNGVPFIGATVESSLLMAVFDPDVRANFTLADHANCTADAISDMTLNVGVPSDAELALLRGWLAEGGPDN